MKQTGNNNILKSTINEIGIKNRIEHRNEIPEVDKEIKYLSSSSVLLGAVLPDLKQGITSSNLELRESHRKSKILSSELENIFRFPFILNQTCPELNELYKMAQPRRNSKKQPFQYCLY